MEDKMPYRDEIFSKAVRAGKRTYFFDVKTTKGNDLYLTITESKKKTNHDGKSHYEKHKIFLYKEDFSKFPTVFVLDNNSEKKIIELLDHILNNYYELYEKTGMAKEYIISKYSWNKISKKLIDPFLN